MEKKSKIFAILLIALGANAQTIAAALPAPALTNKL